MGFTKDAENIELPPMYKKEKKEVNVPNFLAFRWIVVMLGFFVYFIVFFSLSAFSVAMVAMVKTKHDPDDVGIPRDTCVEDIKKIQNISSETSEEKDSDGEFDWSASDQGAILGAYFWGYVFAKLLASRISEVIGQRAMVAGAIAAGAFLVIFTPFVAPIHPYALAANRFLVGACFGPTSSATQSLLSAWAPRNELSSMVTTVISGGTLGSMLGLVVTGWLNDVIGWEKTLWVEGISIFLFLPFWIVLVRNNPKEHPWLSRKEKKLLDENKHVTVRRYVPWFKILTCPYVYICVLGHFGKNCLDAIITVEGPAFFTYKLGMKLTTASYICSGANLASVICLLMFGRFSDLIIAKKLATKIFVRKLFHAIGAGGAGLTLLGICLANCNSTVVTILWIVMGGLTYATACSYSVSIIDLAPNYTATVNGLLGFGNLGGSITPMVTAMFLSQVNGWNKTFFMVSGVSLLSCVLYVVFITEEPQPWNFGEDSPSKKK